MDNSALILGPIALSGFEVPSGVRFGGQQRLAVHQLLDGGRIVDATGRDDSDISFSGVFSGRTAAARARAVDQLRSSGAELPIIWNAFFYVVIIRDFCADYRNSSWIPFSLCCAVLQNKPGYGVVGSLARNELLANDIALALQASGQVGFALAIDPASAGAAQLSEARQNLELQILSNDDLLAGSSLSDTSSADAALFALPQAIGASQTQATLSVASGYAGRALFNSGIQE